MSSTVENENIVRQFVEEVLNGGNAAAADKWLSDDHVLHYMLMPGPMVGKKDWEASAAGYFNAFPDMKITIDDMISQGDQVCARWTATATSKGPLMGIPPNGKSLRWIGTGVYRIANGKIVEQWGIDDAMGLMRQLGAIPG